MGKKINFNEILIKLQNMILFAIDELRLDYTDSLDLKTFFVHMDLILSEYVENPQITRIKYSQEIEQARKNLFRVS